MASSQLFILAIVLAMTASLVECFPKNVALATNEAECRASSQQDASYPCEKAIDGWTYPRTGEWASKGQGVGAWLEITFKETYRLLGGRIMQRLHNTEQSKDVRLEFDWSEENIDIELTEVDGKAHDDTSAAVWDLVEFKTEEDRPCTKRVRLDIMSVYSSGNNGFIEVEFYAEETCTLKCDQGTTSAGGGTKLVGADTSKEGSE